MCIKHTHTHYTLLETHIKDLPKGHGFRKASGLLTNPNKSLEEQKGTNMRRYSSCLSSRFFCDDMMTLTAALCSVTFHGTSGMLRNFKMVQALTPALFEFASDPIGSHTVRR